MGLERIAAVLQVFTTTTTLIFSKPWLSPLLRSWCRSHNHTSLRVVADHLRSCAFPSLMVSSQVTKVVVTYRRILRRAIRHGNKLGA